MRDLRARGLAAHRRRPGARPQRVHAADARPRGVRQRAAAALQRRAGRAARELQGGALRVRAERRRDDGVDVNVEPPLPQVAIGAAPVLVDGPCDDWRRLSPARPSSASRARPRRRSRAATRASCGERDWYVALLDHPTLRARHVPRVLRRGGRPVRRRRARRARAARREPFAVLESPPLYDVVRDVNKLSNNVMARQIFLTLATTAAPPPATPEKAADAVQRWLGATQARRCPGS